MDDDTHSINSNRGYTPEVESVLRKHAQNLSALKWMCSTEATTARKRHKWFALPINILSSLIGSGSAMTLITSYSDLTLSACILNILMILTSILTTLNVTLNFQQKATLLSSKAGKYAELFNDIQNVLIKDIKNRPHVDVFYEPMLLEIEHHTTNGNAPHISDKTRELYEIELKTHGYIDFSNPYDIAVLTTSARKRTKNRENSTQSTGEESTVNV